MISLICGGIFFYLVIGILAFVTVSEETDYISDKRWKRIVVRSMIIIFWPIYVAFGAICCILYVLYHLYKAFIK